MFESRLEVFLSDMPGGTSTQNMLHWIQLVHSGRNQMYDWESEEKNMQKYGQVEQMKCLAICSVFF